MLSMTAAAVVNTLILDLLRQHCMCTYAEFSLSMPEGLANNNTRMVGDLVLEGMLIAAKPLELLRTQVARSQADTTSSRHYPPPSAA